MEDTTQYKLRKISKYAKRAMSYIARTGEAVMVDEHSENEGYVALGESYVTLEK